MATTKRATTKVAPTKTATKSASKTTAAKKAAVTPPLGVKIDPMAQVSRMQLDAWRRTLEEFAHDKHFRINSSMYLNKAHRTLSIWIDSPFNNPEPVFRVDIDSHQETTKLRQSINDIVQGRIVTELFPPSITKVVSSFDKSVTIPIHHWRRQKTEVVGAKPDAVAVRYSWIGVDEHGNILVTVADGVRREITPANGRITFVEENGIVKVFNSWGMPQLKETTLADVTKAVKKTVAKKAAVKTAAKKTVAKKTVAKKAVKKVASK